MHGAFPRDYVSRPDAVARLYPKLLEASLLDALEQLDGEPASEPEAFLAALSSPVQSRRPYAGFGEDVRLRADGIVGSALELGGELIQPARSRPT